MSFLCMLIRNGIFFSSIGPRVIDWWIIYGFTSHSRIFHLYGDVNITDEGLQNFDLCSALRAFEQGGIFIVPHPLWHGTSDFPVSFEGPMRASFQSPLTTHKGMWRIYSESDPHGCNGWKSSRAYTLAVAYDDDLIMWHTYTFPSKLIWWIQCCQYIEYNSIIIFIDYNVIII
jgi:hypothetical protein